MFNNTRRDFLKAIGIGAASMAVPGYSSFAQQPRGPAAKNRPNILF
ncbi:MAG: twin-arginine translocation signal domain-containing protein, partial [Planctomycetota bacterium]